MTAFEKKVILVQQLQAGSVRIGTPVQRPGARSTQKAFAGDPNGSVAGVRGDVVFDTITPAIWQKTGSLTIATLDGWVQQSTGGGTSQADLAYGLRITGLNIFQQNGSVNTSVLLFGGSATPDFPTLPLVDWVVQDNSPTEGTSFQITMQGKYVASLSVPTNTNGAGENVFASLTLDASGAILTTQACALMGLQSSIQAAAFNADDSLPAEFSLGAPFSVTQEMIDSGLGVFRAHAIPGEFTQATHVGLVLRRTGNASVP